MKKIFFYSLVFSAYSLSAQNITDATRYSQTTFGGTARNVAMAGSFGALGADFSSIGTNPAGLGVYKTSEFVFSSGIDNKLVETNYNGSASSDFKYNFNLSNIGLVAVANVITDSSKWRNFNFAIGYNRLQSFHNNSIYQGYNSKGSLLDVFLNDANSGNGVPANQLDAFGSKLAYETYLINPVANSSSYSSAIPNGGALQTYTKEEKGRMNEMLLSVGANYDNRLFLGAALGLPFVNYESNTSHTEADKQDIIAGFNSFTFNQKLKTTGVGVNVKLGFIYRLNEVVRIGAAIHTPSILALSDSYSNSMQSNTRKADTSAVIYGTYNYNSPDGTFDYELITPFKAILSTAFVINKKGLINIDYELINYSTAKLGPGFLNENTTIRTENVSTANLKIGGEYNFNPFIVRLGYANYGSPTGVSANNRNSFTGGVGYREKAFYIDFAFAKTISTADVYLYNKSLTTASTTDYTANSFVVTTGFKF